MFLPQNVLYTFIYINSSFRYDEFQDMRICTQLLPKRNFFLWIKCYSRLESSEVFHYFWIIILTERKKRKSKERFLSKQPMRFGREAGKEEGKKNQNKPSTCIFEHGLIVTDHSFHSYRYLWAEKKRNIEMLERSFKCMNYNTIQQVT